MHYNFDEPVDRFGTDSLKWDGMKMYYQTTDLIPMWVADMDLRCCQEIIDALSDRAGNGIYGYGVKFNDYYQALMGWYQRRHHLALERPWLLYLPNVVTGLRCAISQFSSPGDGVALLSPVYGPFGKSAEQLGRVVNASSLVRQGNTYVIDFNSLEEQLAKSKLLLFCSPHNPAGRVWTHEELTRVGALCLKHHVVLVSDEIHSDLIQPGHTFTPFLALGGEIAQNCIAMTSVSKTFNCAGLMGATAIIPNPDLRNCFSKPIVDFNLYMTNVFTITGVKAAYSHGDEWVDQVVAYIGDNYRFLCEFLSRHLPQVTPIQLQGSYLAWLDCHGIADTEETLKELMEGRARVAGELGSQFGGEGYLYYRLNLATRRAVVEDTLQRIVDAVNGK